MHTESGVDRRQVVANGALADVEVGGDGGDTLAVEQAGEYRPFTAGELAELRFVGKGGQPLEPRDQPGGVQLVGRSAR